MKERVVSLIKVLAPILLFATVIVAACFAAESSTENDAFPSLRNGGAVTITDTVFTGRGKITSFDIDAEGNILLCIDPGVFGLDRHKYLMLLRPDGSLLRTYEYYGNNSPAAGFTEEGNIVVYQARDTQATVIDTQGNILYTYTDENAREASRCWSEGRRTFGELTYSTKGGKSKLTVRGGRTPEEVLFEIPSASQLFLIVWLFHMALAVGVFCCLYRARSRELQKNAHLHYTPPEGPGEEQLYGCFTGEDEKSFGCFTE